MEVMFIIHHLPFIDFNFNIKISHQMGFNFALLFSAFFVKFFVKVAISIVTLKWGFMLKSDFAFIGFIVLIFLLNCMKKILG